MVVSMLSNVFIDVSKQNMYIIKHVKAGNVQTNTDISNHRFQFIRTENISSFKSLSKIR